MQRDLEWAVAKVGVGLHLLILERKGNADALDLGRLQSEALDLAALLCCGELVQRQPECLDGAELCAEVVTPDGLACPHALSHPEAELVLLPVALDDDLGICGGVRDAHFAGISGHEGCKSTTNGRDFTREHQFLCDVGPHPGQ